MLVVVMGGWVGARWWVWCGVEALVATMLVFECDSSVRWRWSAMVMEVWERSN